MTRLRSYAGKAKRAVKKSVNIAKEEGVTTLLKKAAKKANRIATGVKHTSSVKDILFIHEYHINYIERYRVDHPMEQMQFYGMTSDKVAYDSLTLDLVKNYRGFIFYRCPVTPAIQEFVRLAKSMNKTCFFSVDDLVIDTKYTDTIEEVMLMPREDKRNYDNGVDRMQATMRLCDYGIATTERLRDGMGDYGLKDVYINRNVMSDEMIHHSQEALKVKKLSAERIVIGYFSGSITHNEDFAMVMPALIEILNTRENVYLKIAGIIDVPDNLKPFQDRIIRMEFKEDWRELPREIAECDFVLAPLVESIFNESKSEIKWTEASLVKVPVVSSDIGAFQLKIKNGVTGVLVESTVEKWVEALKQMVDDSELRQRIAQNAYEHVMDVYKTSSFSAGELVNFVKDKLSPNVGIVLPSTNISGGVIVALKHAQLLRKNGFDVSLINIDHTRGLKLTSIDTGDSYNVFIDMYDDINMYFDNMVATMWHTLDYIERYPKRGRTTYLVQNYETDFYPYGNSLRAGANSTYFRGNTKYITMSRWCQSWLKRDFNAESEYASNGLDLKSFPIRERDFTGKIKILVEGDSSVDYKRVDESFKVIEGLQERDIEVSYLSYNGKPKDWYRVDNFYNKISPSEVGEVYASHDILIKSSVLESFSYPPLEMMATGGIAVIVPNDGNAEYAVADRNCVAYASGDTEAAVRLIDALLSDKKYRDDIIAGGLRTAQAFSWDSMESDIIDLYR